MQKERKKLKWIKVNNLIIDNKEQLQYQNNKEINYENNFKKNEMHGINIYVQVLCRRTHQKIMKNNKNIFKCSINQKLISMSLHMVLDPKINKLYHNSQKQRMKWLKLILYK